jgi:peptidoglycan/LPS O-acetylase OafA/YrhL
MSADRGSEDVSLSARRRYFPAVEGMRGVAALTVLFGHVLFFGHPNSTQLQILGPLIAAQGVAIFFAISGFVLYRPFVAARASGPSVGSVTPSFLWRRFVRIFPAYWVALTLLAIWPGLEGVFSGHWWAYYALIHVNFSAWVTGGLGPAWSLSAELTFYLALPLIALVLATRGAGSLGRRRWGWEVGVVGGLGLATLAWIAVSNPTPFIRFPFENLLGTFIWFSSGMLIAALQVTKPPGLARLSRVVGRPEICWPLAAGLFAVLQFRVLIELGASPHLYAALQELDFALIAALIVAPAMLGSAGRLVNLLLANRVAVFLGTISYGIYLYHFPIVVWLVGTGFVARSPAPVVLTGLITLAASVSLGTVSWYLIEKPLMRRARSTIASRHIGRTTEADPRPPVPPPVAKVP